MVWDFTINVPQPKELNIYSHLRPLMIEPFLTTFTENLGIKTKVVHLKRFGLSPQDEAKKQYN